MTDSNKPKSIKWTKEAVIVDALKYSTKVNCEVQSEILLLKEKGCGVG